MIRERRPTLEEERTSSLVFSDGVNRESRDRFSVAHVLEFEDIYKTQAKERQRKSGGDRKTPEGKKRLGVIDSEAFDPLLEAHPEERQALSAHSQARTDQEIGKKLISRFLGWNETRDVNAKLELYRTLLEKNFSFTLDFS